ncbi:reverse transcriptase domain-containing protein [Tanacetum coccineum]
MADQRTMAELLQAPTEGYGDAIVTPAILAKNFELKHGLLNLAWDRFKDLLRACPHHGFTELHQLDTFYNALNPIDQDSLNAAAGGNLLTKTPRDALTIIENKSNVRNLRNKPVVSKVSANNSSSTTTCPSELAALTDAVNVMLRHVKTSPPDTVKAIPESCVTCGGPHPYYECLAADGNTFNASAAAATYNQNQGYRGGTGTRGDKGYSATEYQKHPTSGSPNSSSFDEPVVAPKPKPFIPYPSRANKKRHREKDDNLASKFVEIFQDLHFELSFADVLLYMPKFASIFKSLLNNKEKLFDLAKAPVNENCSAVILKNLHEKLRDPDKFLIPCDFPEIVECLALVDLGASINLMPLSMWKKLSLPELTPTQMILELEDLKTDRLLVHPLVKLRDTPTIMLNQLIELMSSMFHAQEVLGFLDSSKSGNPTPSLDPIISTSFPSLTPFKRGDFILEEIKACLTNDSIPSGIDDADFDPEGDLLLLEKLLNDDPSSPLPPKELHFEEIKTIKSSIDDPPELELKDLPSHLEYAFLEGTYKLPVIIYKELKDEEKDPLLKVLKSHKRAIAWKISDIKAVDYLSKWVEAKALPTNDARFVVKFLKSLFALFGTPRAIISDRGTHFCKDQFAKVMLKYRVTHRLSTVYHPQTSRQVEVSNRGLKRILERTVGENRASWSDKLDDALWAFHSALKTPIECTPYKLVYGKACHLPIELEHKAYWALKHCIKIDCLDFKDSRARGFVHRSLDLQSLACLFMGIQYP